MQRRMQRRRRAHQPPVPKNIDEAEQLLKDFPRLTGKESSSVLISNKTKY